MLEDFLDRVPWLPVLYVEATDALESKINIPGHGFLKKMSP